jgi:hypothetical protein
MLVATLLIALSGWQGKVHFTHDPPRKSGGSDGAIHVAGDRVRIEEPTPLGPTVILAAGAKVRLLFPERRRFLEIDPAQAPLTVPPLSLEGMKRIGEEVIAGHPCTIWERILKTPAGTIHQRLWVPANARKFVFVRFVTQTPRGATRADITDLREAPQPRSLFRTPGAYRPN